jgi:hypothetical protein
MFTRRLLLALTLGLFFMASRAEAQLERSEAPAERHFGLGLIVGHPTGLSLKGYLSPTTAIDGAIGFGDTFRLIHVHADYLWHFEVQRWGAANLQLYLGIGPELAVHARPGPARPDGRTDFFLGARAPFGFSMMFSAPFDVFAELVAGLWFLEDPRVHIDAALGGRYWF